MIDRLQNRNLSLLLDAKSLQMNSTRIVQDATKYTMRATCNGSKARMIFQRDKARVAAGPRGNREEGALKQEALILRKCNQDGNC